MEKQTHVSILISIILLSIVIHYVAMPFLYEYSFPFQIVIGISTLLIDIIACSYILYFSNIKRITSFILDDIISWNSFLFHR